MPNDFTVPGKKRAERTAAAEDKKLEDAKNQASKLEEENKGLKDALEKLTKEFEEFKKAQAPKPE